jgi:hypothetical protein
MVLVWPMALVVPNLFAAPPVLFEGERDCPSPQAIAHELERIVTLPEGSTAVDSALIAVEGNELRVVLVAHDGRLLGERRLPAEGTCDERALSVAVVLGAWIASEHPEYSATLPDSPHAPLTTPDADAGPPPLPVPSALPPPPPQPAPPAPARSPTPPPPPAPARDAGWKFEPALAAGIELSDAGVVPAAHLSLRFAPAGTGFGATAFALLAGPEERNVGSGRVSSFRWPLGVGGAGRLERFGAAFDVSAGGMLGVLHLEGKGFTTNDATTDVQGGLFAALRIGAGSGRFRPFGAAALLTWLGTATASASLPDAEHDLPVFEGVFVAGLGFAP